MKQDMRQEVYPHDWRDVEKSYSADRIALGKPVAKPFRWKHSNWIAVSPVGECAECYEIESTYNVCMPIKTYREKAGSAESAEAARNDPNGFYDSMEVSMGTSGCGVLLGPPVIFRKPEKKVKA